MQTDPDEKRLSELEAKWLNGTIGAEEAKEYADWYNQEHDSPVEIPASFAVSEEEHKERVFQKINSRRLKVVPIRTRLLRVASVAAALVLFTSAAYWFFDKKPAKTTQKAATATAFNNDVAPGKTQATLTLGNGQTIVLDTASNGLLAQQGATSIVNKDGTLTYTGVKGDVALQYNTLTTHKGEQYPVTLSDGTKVWLNAESALRFPVQFSDTVRQVEVSGEAYFEVATVKTASGKDKMPFTVKIKTASGNGGEVRVLGTHFNINAYSDEPAIKTTLLEGSVKIDGSVVLRPGQQSQREQNGSLKVADNVDTDEVVAWKNGNFTYSNTDISTLMRQVGRWYDIEVVYEGQKTKDRFAGSISRTASLSQLLKILELSRVHFKLEGKQLTVLP